MQETSSEFKALYNSGQYETETKVVIDGVQFLEDRLMDVSIQRELFGSDVAIGCACVGSCSVTLITGDQTGRELSDTIPRGAPVQIFERIRNYDGSQVSEWLSQGLFYIDERDYTSWSGRLALNCVDRMAMADGDFVTDDMNWPKPDRDVVTLIAQQMGVGLADGVLSLLNKNYSIGNPVTTYTLRETLGFIGVMYCGNWVIDKDGQLAFLSLNGLPDESFYLVTEYGNNITFGGVRILVEG